MTTFIDVVMASDAKTKELWQTTNECLRSLFASEDEDIRFLPVIMESCREASYPEFPAARVIYPEMPFGYHKFMNMGRKLGRAPYVCLCNNDLFFEKKWATRMLAAMAAHPDLLSTSPYNRNGHQRYGIEYGSGIRRGHRLKWEITGWCIFQKREIYQIIGDLDERFVFWYADDDYANTLRKHDVGHALVTDSVVNHLISQTLKTCNTEERNRLTLEQKAVFEAKWGVSPGWMPGAGTALPGPA